MDLGMLYQFAYRGQLAEEALDSAGRTKFANVGESEAEMAATLSLGLLDDEFAAAARHMSTVYTAIAAFENSARALVSSTMLEGHGEDWWETVSSSVRKKAKGRQDEDERHRFHSQRGDAPINYTDLTDLLNIMNANQELFEPFLPNTDWAKSIFEIIERSRNVIMHSGTLEPRDIARVGINIRDWITQVGA
jgi:Rad3-related DNA helicase